MRGSVVCTRIHPIGRHHTGVRGGMGEGGSECCSSCSCSCCYSGSSRGSGDTNGCGWDGSGGSHWNCWDHRVILIYRPEGGKKTRHVRREKNTSHPQTGGSRKTRGIPKTRPGINWTSIFLFALKRSSLFHDLFQNEETYCSLAGSNNG